MINVTYVMVCGKKFKSFLMIHLLVCKSCEKEGGVHKLIPGQMNFILKGAMGGILLKKMAEIFMKK